MSEYTFEMTTAGELQRFEPEFEQNEHEELEAYISRLGYSESAGNIGNLNADHLA